VIPPALLRRIAALMFALAALPAGAQINLDLGGSADDLLEPERAFQFSARALDPASIEVRFAIADGYYLYRDKFKFALAAGSAAKLGTPQLPAGIRKKDEFFGEVETYRKEVRIRVPVERAGAAAETLELAVTSQGCADIGVCYVPMDSKASIHLAAAAASGPGAAGPSGLTEAPPSVAVAPRFSIFASDLDIAALFEGNVLLVLAGFFGFGLLLAFTPCVLPMIPILSGIIAGEGKRLTKVRALLLSSAYVLGMALAYAAAGVAAAYSGTLLAAALQNAWVLGAFALVFVWLALAMFGLYDVQLPGFLRHKLHAAHGRLEGGRIASVAAMGVLSAAVVSPCVAAPLAGALLYISQTQNVVLGGAALFSMALGMGVPLIAVGVSEGALLPRSGAWMDGVKKLFGVLLLAVAVWIVSPVIPVAAQMIAWAALLVGSGVALRAIDPLPANAAGWARVGKALGYRPSERLTVVLYEHQQFQDVTRVHGWATGLFDGKIRLPVGPALPPARELERLIVHEYAHAAIHHLSRGRAPRWLHEGLAQALEGAAADPMLRVPGSLTLAGVEALVADPDPLRARAGYDIALWIVRDLLDRGGMEAMRELLARLGAGEAIAEATLAVYGLRLAEIESQWRRLLGG